MYRVYLSRYVAYLATGRHDLMLCSILAASGSPLVPLINRIFYWHMEHCASCLLFDLGGDPQWRKDQPMSSSVAVRSAGK